MCNYHRPVCVACRVDMRPEQNDVRVLDVANFGPYQLWSADLWKCPECGSEVVMGFGTRPIHAHYEEGFDAFLEKSRGLDKVIELRPA